MDVFTGSLKRVLFKIFIAKEMLKVDISQIIVPAQILAIQKATEPFPLPIRTSVGFLVIGVCGKTVNITRPFFFIRFLKKLYKVISCFDVIRKGSKSLKPICPYFKEERKIFILLKDFPF